MHSMTHPQAMWLGPLLPVLLSLSLFPASSGTVRRRTEGPQGGRCHPRALPQCREGGGAVWPLFHPTLSESLQSVVLRLNLPSPGPVRLHWALSFSFSLPSPPPHFRASAVSSDRLCLFHCLCLSLPVSTAPSACLGPSGCCLLGGKSTVFCPQGSLGAVPDPRAGLPLARGHPHTQPGAQPGSHQFCRPLAQGGVTLELPGPVCLAVMQTS